MTMVCFSCGTEHVVVQNHEKTFYYDDEGSEEETTLNVAMCMTCLKVDFPGLRSESKPEEKQVAVQESVVGEKKKNWWEF